MHLFHCWHKVEGSERKIPYKSKCKLDKQPKSYHSGGYINYTIEYICCIYHKVKESSIYRDYDIQRANKYKIKEN